MIKILIIDDDYGIRELLRDFFEMEKYQVFTTSKGKVGLNIIKKEKPHLVFLDIGLPDISGLDLIPKIKEIDVNIKIIILSGYDEEDKISDAKYRGANDYITKPFNLDYLEDVVISKVYKQLFIEMQNDMDEKIKSYEQIIHAFSKVIEEKDSFAKGHSERVVKYGIDIAKKLNLPENDIFTISNAGLLLDIGKINLKEEILNKQDKLTEEEWEEVKKHPVIGSEILRVLDHLKEHYYIVRNHHERWDGAGYPDKMKGTEIPLLVRVLAIADAYDAMTSERPYRREMSEQEAISELIKNKGTQFDPELVDTFLVTLEDNHFINGLKYLNR